MRIKLTAVVLGAWKGKPGDEVDRPDAEAQRLVKAGFAIALDPPPKLETATVSDELETTSKA